MRFVLDHSLSPRLSEILRVLDDPPGHTLLHLRTFPSETKDPAWLQLFGQTDPDVIIVTADPGISRSPANRAAWLESRLTIFFLRSVADLKPGNQAWRLIKEWPEIVKHAARAKKGSGFVVSIHGKIEPLRSGEGARLR